MERRQPDDLSGMLFRVWTVSGQREDWRGQYFEETASTDCTLEDAIEIMRDALKRGLVVGARPESKSHRGDPWKEMEEVLGKR